MLTTMKGEIDSNTIPVGDFNTQLTPMESSSKQKINKETQEKKRTYKNKPITIKNLVIGTYISIITLNVNGLNAPTKRLNGYKNKTCIYPVYKRPTSDLGTHTD